MGVLRLDTEHLGLKNRRDFEQEILSKKERYFEQVSYQQCQKVLLK